MKTTFAYLAIAAMTSFTVSAAELETAAIQGRIDDAWRKGGGTVEIGSGVHMVGTIRIRSNVTLLLRSGAVLRASRNLADYDGWASGFPRLERAI